MKMITRSVFAGIALIFFTTASSFAITLGDALDNTNLVWITATSNATERAWIATNITSHDSVDDAICGNHYLPSSDSWIQTQVVGPGKIGFWWKVSCEDPQVVFPGDPLTYFDYLEFQIGGNSPDWATIDPAAIIAGQVGWEYRTFTIPPGTNTMRWSYIKDDNVNS